MNMNSSNPASNRQCTGILFALATVLCAGCNTITPQHAPKLTQTSHNKQTSKVATPPDNRQNIPDQKADARKPVSPFLKDLSASDIHLIKQEALRTLAPVWNHIDARAQKVRHRVIQALDAMNAPHELMYIPVAESGYNPYALSHAGAFGLWQLMPKTAAALGATNAKGLDGRRHIESSTKAAAKYLLSLHQRFNSWPLAIAAYNLGPWGVQRRLNKQPWQPEMGLNALPFPAETRHYVKQVLGMIALGQDGALDFSEAIETEQVHIPAPVDLNQVEKVSGLPRHEIFRLNPAFDYQHYIHHDISVHLPRDHAQRLKVAMQKNPNIFKPKRITVRVRPGDSLWKLAKTYHTSITYLKKLDPNLHKVLSIGQPVVVPASGSMTIASSKANPLLSKGRRIRYKVRSGDSLWKIAKKFGTSTQAIARANQLSPHQLIRPGDRLWIIAKYRPS